MLSKAIIGAGGTLGGAVTFNGDITTAVYSTDTLNINNLATVRNSGLYISDDGLNLYVAESNTNTVRQYSLSTPWDITTGSYVRSTGSVSGKTADLFFKSDGTKMYVADNNNDNVLQYPLSTAWDISTIGSATSYNAGAIESGLYGLCFSPDGTQMYLCGVGQDGATQFSLSTAWDVTTASYTSKLLQFYYDTSTLETNIRGIYISPDGKYMYGVGQNTDGPVQYELSTPFDISTGTRIAYLDLVAYTSNPQFIFFSTDGNKFWVSKENDSALLQWDMT